MEFGTSLTFLGIGIGVVATLLAAKPMRAWMKRTLFGVSILFILAGAWGLWVGPRGERGDVKSPPPEGRNQTMTNSPGGVQIQGDNNTVKQGPQDRRIKKEDEFIQKMRAAGPVAVRLNTVDGREPEFLHAQLYKLLIDSKWAVEAGGVFAGAVHWVNVSVAVRDRDNLPPAAITLVNQLRLSGIESFLVLEKNSADFVLERNPVTEKADFIVRVGDRPPG